MKFLHTAIITLCLFVSGMVTPLFAQSEATLVLRKQVTTESISALSLAPEGLGFLAYTKKDKLYTYNYKKDTLLFRDKSVQSDIAAIVYLDSVYIAAYTYFQYPSYYHIYIDTYSSSSDSLLHKKTLEPLQLPPGPHSPDRRALNNTVYLHPLPNRKSAILNFGYSERYPDNTYFYGAMTGIINGDTIVDYVDKKPGLFAHSISDDGTIVAQTLAYYKVSPLFVEVKPSPIGKFEGISKPNVFFSTSHRYFLAGDKLFNYAYREPIRYLRNFNQLSLRIPKSNHYVTPISGISDFGIIFIPEDSLVAKYSRNTTSTITSTDINRDGSLVAFGTNDGYVEIWRLPSELPTPDIKPDFYTKGFSGNPITLRLQEKALFVNSTYLEDSNATFQWDFGNGVSSNKIMDSAMYEVPGNYTVTLVITYSDGRKDTVRKENYVHVPGFTKPVTGNILTGSNSNFSSLEISYDNKYALAVQLDHTVSLLDVEQQKLIRSWQETPVSYTEFMVPYTFLGKSNNITSIRKVINPFTGEELAKHNVNPREPESIFYPREIQYARIISDVQGKSLCIGFGGVYEKREWDDTTYFNAGHAFWYDIDQKLLYTLGKNGERDTVGPWGWDVRPNNSYNSEYVNDMARYQDSMIVISHDDSVSVREPDGYVSSTIGYPPGKPKQTRVRVAADGYHIVTADGVWDMFTRTLIHPIDFRTEKYGGEILSSQPFEALPDGRQYLKVNMGQLQLYDTLTKTWDTLSERQIYNQYWSALTSDGKKLITAGENGTILFWDLSKVITGIEERELEYGNECRCIAYPQPSYSSKVTFAIDVGEPTVMRIEIVDIFGQVVHKADIERAGSRRLYEWNTLNTAGEQVRSGVYFVQITTEKGGTCSSKLMIGR